MKQKEEQEIGEEIVFGWIRRLFNKKAQPKKKPKKLDMVGIVLPPPERRMTFMEAHEIIMAPPKYGDAGSQNPKKGDNNKPPTKKA